MASSTGGTGVVSLASDRPFRNPVTVANVRETVSGTNSSAFDFPSLDLTDIHAVISYYLRHRDEVEQYLSDLQDQAGEVRKQIASVVAGGEIRERLLARRANKECKNAADHDG